MITAVEEAFMKSLIMKNYRRRMMSFYFFLIIIVVSFLMIVIFWPESKMTITATSWIFICSVVTFVLSSIIFIAVYFDEDENCPWIIENKQITTLRGVIGEKGKFEDLKDSENLKEYFV
ncbi:MAG: hypothetical protein WDK96_01585 [Candidatus Paceibacterota bacterium]|jgi:hypothetical protein